MDDKQDELSWVIAAKAGNLAAFDLLARRYRPALVAIASPRLGRDEAQDAAQDALLIAFKALPTLDDAARFGPWLAAIVKRRAGRIDEGRREWTPLEEVILAYAPSIIEDLHRAETIASMQTLPSDLAVILGLVALQDWSVADVAGFLELPVSTVKWRLHAARTTLRRRFGYEGEPFHGSK